ncbi:hypothetical protein CKJ89_37880, partial [Klebsiella pneumoniae]
GANGGTEQAKDPNGIFAMPLCGIGISFIDNYISVFIGQVLSMHDAKRVCFRYESERLSYRGLVG